MMIYVPFIYFLIVFIYIVKRRGLDISACIIAAYMLSAFCSIIIFNTDNSYSHKVPTLFPTIIYCAMITFVTYPFYKFNSTKKREIPLLNPKLFNVVSWMFILSFAFSIVLFKDDIMIRLMFGDQIGTLRGVAGDELGTVQMGLNGLMRALSSLCMVILSMSAISFILFFYSVTYLHKKWYFNVLLFLSSFGCIIGGILGIDRSIAFYWIIDLVFIYILMRPYLTDKIRKISMIIGVGVFFLIGSYLVLMTFSRFGDDASASFFDYMGMSYPNFCWFWNNYEAPVVNWGFFFPVTSHFLDIDWGFPVEPVSFGRFVESKVGFFVNVFYTFMGSVMLYLGQWAVIPYCILYYIIANKMINKSGPIGIQTFIKIVILSIVIYNGVILYVLVDYIRKLGALIVLGCCYVMDKKTKIVYDTRIRS